MNNKIWVLLGLFSLSGCSASFSLGSPDSLSDLDPIAYEKSLEVAKVTLKSNKGVKKYKKYYNAPTHKALAQSKVNSVGGYATNKTSKEYAIEAALESCHRRLLKKYDEITDRVSCEIINIDNEWQTK